MKEILAVIASVVFLTAVWAALAVYERQGKIQPVAYNHKKHLEAGMDCRTCHTGIGEGLASAGLPAIDICLTCHASDDNPKTRPIRDFAAKGRAIPWRRVYMVPDDVFFSHRRHVAVGKLDCALCHGDMAEKETPVERQAVAISMTRCIACHRREGASVDCLACHR